jgi:hypothetical protein
MNKQHHFKNPDIIKNRMEKRKQNSDKMNEFYLNIDNTYFIERDNYNIILSKKCIADKTGNEYIQVVGFYSNIGESIFKKLEELNVNRESIEHLKEKSKNIETEYNDGDLNINLKNNFTCDKR